MSCEKWVETLDDILVTITDWSNFNVGFGF